MIAVSLILSFKGINDRRRPDFSEASLPWGCF